MGEEDKRNMAAQKGMRVTGDARHKDDSVHRERAVTEQCGQSAQTGNRKLHQQLCNSCARERERGEEEEGRGRAERWGLHLNSINTIVLWLSEAELICSPMSHVPSSSF